MRSFRFRISRELAVHELLPRLVPLRNNPLVQPLPSLNAEDREDPVGKDLRDLPRVVGEILQDWASVGTLNRLTAMEFSRSLLAKMIATHNCRNQRQRSTHEVRDLDLLVVGVESSLWVAEQWVSDVTKV